MICFILDGRFYIKHINANWHSGSVDTDHLGPIPGALFAPICLLLPTTGLSLPLRSLN